LHSHASSEERKQCILRESTSAFAWSCGQYEGIFYDGKNIHLYCNYGYMGTYVSPNASNCALKMGHFNGSQY
jgi:hypothetical protein